MRGSVVLTPSLRRRWGIEKLDKTSDDFYVMPLPLQIEEGRIEPFISFTEGYIKGFGGPEDVPYIVSVKLEPGDEEGIPRYDFSFYSSESSAIIDRSFVYNMISISRRPEEEAYSVILKSKGEKEAVQQVGVFARKMAFEWAAQRA
jgi:hypothetical protein